jgi:hypothetical protein
MAYLSVVVAAAGGMVALSIRFSGEDTWLGH